MPRDDWAKARAKDAARKGRNGTSTRKRKNIKRKSSVRATQVIRDRLETMNARLWFGKFNGKRLSEVPIWYLEFLSKLKPTGDRMTILVSFIQQELSKT